MGKKHWFRGNAKLRGKRLRELRERAGISQTQLAARTDISYGFINKMERGLRIDPKLSTIIAICEVLNCKPSELIVVEEEDENVDRQGD